MKLVRRLKAIFQMAMEIYLLHQAQKVLVEVVA
jgi:hypothetical protein